MNRWNNANIVSQFCRFWIFPEGLLLGATHLVVQWLGNCQSVSISSGGVQMVECVHFGPLVFQFLNKRAAMCALWLRCSLRQGVYVLVRFPNRLVQRVDPSSLVVPIRKF
jgi:hypothetical protein